MTDTAQLLVFWGVNGEFEVTIKLAAMNSLHGTIRGENIFKEVEKKTKSIQPELKSAKIHYNWYCGENIYRGKKRLSWTNLQFV